LNCKISIITVCKNSEQTIKKTFDSFKNQKFKDFENIIIDSSSNLKTLNIINRYKLNKTYLKKNMELYEAINKGIKISNGNIIGILHSDDYYSSSKSMKYICEIFKVRNYNAVYGNINIVDKNGNKFRSWENCRWSNLKFLLGWHPPHTSIFFKKSLFKKYGFYKKEYKIASDYDFIKRIFFNNKIEPIYINKFITTMRHGGESAKSLKNIIKANIECIKSWQNDNGYFLSSYIIIFLKLLRKLLIKLKNIFFKK
jgi:glycosyltransferase involved in cell wall biosynthesis